MWTDTEEDMMELDREKLELVTRRLVEYGDSLDPQVDAVALVETVVDGGWDDSSIDIAVLEIVHNGLGIPATDEVLETILDTWAEEFTEGENE
jgi:hypothetical protein